jgi:alcohol dehydrogenase (cytochrome c)
MWSYFAQEIDAVRPPEGAGYIAGGIGGFFGDSLGVLAALDMRSNELVWQEQWAEPCYSGSAVTKGGLLFVGRSDGRLTALDKLNGRKLWEFQTGAGMNAPVSVFEHDGRELVLAYSAGNLYAGSARGDSVWLFSLDGTLEPATVASPVPTTSATGGAGNTDAGKSVFDAACQFCHGAEGEGGHGGGPSLAAARDPDTVRQIVSEGRNDMPAFGTGVLTHEQIRNVAAYVTQRLARRAAADRAQSSPAGADRAQ